MVPAACQGILALQIRKKDTILKEELKKITDGNAFLCQKAERAFLNEIGADCHAPAGALATVKEGKIRMKVMFYADRLRLAEGEEEIQKAEKLGKTLAEKLGIKSVCQ